MNYIKKILKLKTNDEIINYIDKIEYKELENIINILDENYYAKKPLIEDNIYDIIRNFTNNKFPDSELCKKIGYTPENKVKLKYHMGSENKTYVSDNKLTDWIKQYGKDELILSAKADGISVLWDVKSNKIFSRGDGKYGKDISHFIKYFNFSDDKNITNIDILNAEIFYIRGELIINKPENRNIVSGQINRNEIDEEMASKIYFVAYELLEPRLSQYDQFTILSSNKIRTVKYFKIDKNIISYDYLNELYNKLKTEILYYIDGIIIRNNDINLPIKTGNPPWSICFKQTDKIYTTTVKEIIWEISKKNIYIPKAILDPIVINNTTISAVTCYNAKFIIDNDINTGSIVEIIKKGGVIPIINKIIKKSDIKIKLPEGKIVGVNIIYNGINKDSEVKKIVYFFKYLKYNNITTKVISNLYDKGYDNILKYFDTIIDIPEYNKQKNYIKLLDTIEIIKTKNYTIVDILSALSLDNLSTNRICSIYSNFPKFLEENSVKDYSSINGIGKLSSEKINNTIMENYDFIKNILKALNIEY
ncbi:NAD-dependent DNA ligase [Mythimna separata entomopoxvirus 'L']|uniref:NAD-dependent DNA ligase n=1 Tax=Mythimna separata entomopoxvirus 'L' TaxID=1293572 RepID=A0A916KQD1_9POXV|nr:NAD-dependent DNA ligase [Mythimna separata entomopoxvirus 'L']CCU56422.1 NAD-dependent DNA ligase [Mythimna separata entomopoxvirus 'L']